LVLQGDAKTQDIQLPVKRLVVKLQTIGTEAMLGMLKVKLGTPVSEGLVLPRSFALGRVFHCQNDRNMFRDGSPDQIGQCR
jgi:hypothetical protein